LILRKAAGVLCAQADAMSIGRRIATTGIMAPVIALTACAHQPAAQSGAPGFLAGLLQGLTAWIALLASIVMPIRPYAFPNDGFWYDAGFISGFSASIVILILCLIARIGGFITRGH